MIVVKVGDIITMQPGFKKIEVLRIEENGDFLGWDISSADFVSYGH
jgi:hypothetical protein